jgi:hypothetical protein
MRESGELKGDYMYKNRVLSSLIIDERETQIDDREYLVEAMFLFMQPDAYKEWKSKNEALPEEEGLAGVNYMGESEEAFKEFERLGLLDVPTTPG